MSLVVDETRYHAKRLEGIFFEFQPFAPLSHHRILFSSSDYYYYYVLAVHVPARFTTVAEQHNDSAGRRQKRKEKY